MLEVGGWMLEVGCSQLAASSYICQHGSSFHSPLSSLEVAPSDWPVHWKHKKPGLKYLIIEKGCLVNSYTIIRSIWPSFSTSERLEIGGVPFVSNNAKPDKTWSIGILSESSRFTQREYSFVWKMCKGESTRDRTQSTGRKCMLLKRAGKRYTADHVIIATGFMTSTIY